MKNRNALVVARVTQSMNVPVVKEAVDIIVIISGLMIIVIGADLKKNQKLLLSCLLDQIIQKFLNVENQT